MKYRVTPTQNERVMREDDFIISKTDLKGRITYGNRIFIEFSGYTEQELIGSSHNIIRHPDMPRGVFKLLWDTVSQGNEIFAYVKNMSKDGSFYWVFANVTPNRDLQGHIEGFFSARRQPRRGAIGAVSDLYRAMLDEELRAGPRDACDASLALVQNILKDKGVSYEQFVLSL
ncbi:PAS domain-containing protein [Curvibacter sp. APW13]|uniref:PAS domain-containing protein n=1 Tax=Curvibacter sp. APW13 TaxID=3077236 RepID=UPI0028E06F48|nr:PAS domain-containing protein [Curvibacter sp. APW13]MDT8990101.1 PAS domain-containing protein [Curvibacter sp. APW13]